MPSAADPTLAAADDPDTTAATTSPTAATSTASTAAPTATTPLAAAPAPASVTPPSITAAPGGIPGPASAATPASADRGTSAFDSAGTTVPTSTDLTSGFGNATPSGTGVLSKMMGLRRQAPDSRVWCPTGLSSLIGGWTSTLTPAQVAALNSQAAAKQAAANLTTHQTQSLAAPKAVASSAPVTGAPQPLVPTQQAGLINTAPNTAVTGKVAAG